MAELASVQLKLLQSWQEASGPSCSISKMARGTHGLHGCVVAAAGCRCEGMCCAGWLLAGCADAMADAAVLCVERNTEVSKVQ